jgi:hypothetical protein
VPRFDEAIEALEALDIKRDKHCQAVGIYCGSENARTHWQFGHDMRRTPHFLSFGGYFDELTSEALNRFCSRLTEIKDHPENYFSIDVGTELDTVDYHYEIITEAETLKSDSTEPTVLDEFVQAVVLQKWEQANLRVEHGRRTPNLGIRHIGAHLSEVLEATFEHGFGSCVLKAHFRDNEITESTLTRLYEELELSEKPKKASRYIPEALETQLLCDSMHLCNVCRESGIIIHHIVPVEHGGETTEGNLVVLCLNHHHHAHSRSSLAKNLRPQHLQEYKRRHLEWVALKRSNSPLGPFPGNE